SPIPPGLRHRGVPRHEDAAGPGARPAPQGAAPCIASAIIRPGSGEQAPHAVSIDDFVVEAGREDHIARHGVSLAEVEEVTLGQHAAYRVRDDRYGLIGQTEAGRYLTVIV